MPLDYEKCKKLMLERWSKFCDDFVNKNDSEIVADLCCSVIAEESEVLKEETDPRTPREKMQEKFCDIFDEANLGFTAWDMNERHGDEPCPGFFNTWDNFLCQIGEAMGPMCYAAWILSSKFKQAKLDTSWINTCVSYYEKNWEF